MRAWDFIDIINVPRDDVIADDDGTWLSKPEVVDKGKFVIGIGAMAIEYECSSSNWTSAYASAASRNGLATLSGLR
jgi:hypothetical protein